MKHPRIKSISPHHQKRLAYISAMLKEMRFSEGKNQDAYIDYGVSRRQVQRGENRIGNNISLITLFKLLDAYGYRLDDFFEGME